MVTFSFCVKNKYASNNVEGKSFFREVMMIILYGFSIVVTNLYVKELCILDVCEVEIVP